jgi:glycosyltransferase involved in cell wall biosynthesis
MRSEPTISVVIPTYNRKELLENCVNSLFNQTYPKDGYDILVIDDGSDDGTEDLLDGIIKNAPCELRYLKQEHKGPASARNLGIKNSKGEIVAFIDDDCIADENWLENISMCFNEDVAGVEGRIITTSDKTPFSHYVENLYGGFYLTANVAYKKETLLEVGLFDETYPYPAAEDFDLAFKILERGHKISFCENVIVTHPPVKESLKEYYKTRRYWFSAIKLYEKHPDIVKTKQHNSILKLILFYIFINPFVEVNKWKAYLIGHIPEIPLFIVKQLLDSLYASYVLLIYLKKSFFRRWTKLG